MVTDNENVNNFYRAMLRRARYCYVCPSFRLSVCLSVTLRFCDHMRLNSLKIVSPLVSLRCLLSVDLLTDLLKNEHPEFLAGLYNARIYTPNFSPGVERWYSLSLGLWPRTTLLVD